MVWPIGLVANNYCFLLFYCSAYTSGPFKINGVPIRRVNQSYVIATSTKVDISGVSLDKFDDKYFAKEAKNKKKKGEGEFFEAEKEVCFLQHNCVCILLDSWIFLEL